MVRKFKNVYRFQNQNRFSFTRPPSPYNRGWYFVGRFEQREYDGVVSWSFVFAAYAREDAAANQWITEQLGIMNEQQEA